MFRLLFLSCYIFGFVILETNGRTTTPQGIMFYDVESAPTLFVQYMQDFDKKYDSDLEMINRFQIFKQNLLKINELNKKYNLPTFGFTIFSDWSPEEFSSLNSCSFPNATDSKRLDLEITAPVEDSLDWRDKGAVTEVKNQKHCGSCWTFSTTGEVEGQNAIKNGNLVSFSEQELVDCSKHNSGCGGGVPHQAMIDIAELGGFEAEESYPYEAVQKECRFKKDKVVFNIKGGSQLNVDENGLAGVLAKHGPLSIAIDACHEFQLYNGVGVLDPDCHGKPGHAVLLVGYGPNYWIIKNSWGKTWGASGYIKLIRGKKACSIGSYVAASQ